jgi:hypothetical protein
VVKITVAKKSPETEIERPSARTGVGKISDAYTYDVASQQSVNIATCRNKKATAPEAAARWPVCENTETVMHSPIKARMQPVKPITKYLTVSTPKAGVSENGRPYVAFSLSLRGRQEGHWQSSQKRQL